MKKKRNVFLILNHMSYSSCESDSGQGSGVFSQKRDEVGYKMYFQGNGRLKGRQQTKK